MRKKWIIIGAIAFVIISVGTTAVLLLKHEPAFYHRCHLPPSDARAMHSTKFSTEFYQFLEQIREGSDKWAFSFSQDEINSFFFEGYVHLNEAKAWKDKFNISQPRLMVDKGRIRLGFYYGSGLWSCLVSLELKIWLVPKEVNLLALEIVDYRAGAVPISTSSLMDRITQFARSEKIEVNWHRHAGNPVALLRFQSERSRPSFHLQHMELQPGKILVSGISFEQQNPNPTAAPHELPVVSVSDKTPSK